MNAPAERVSPQAAAYHKSRIEFHQVQGMSLTQAEDAADMDLLEWSKPLELPDPPMSHWFE